MEREIKMAAVQAQTSLPAQMQSQRRPIYLDYMATTPLDPRVRDEMLQSCWCGGSEMGGSIVGGEQILGNANAMHLYGERSRQLVELARERLATLIGGRPEGVIWTSGATESNNLAIQGVAQFYRRSGKHLITSRIEHSSVIKSFQALERAGFEVDYLTPDRNGVIDIGALERVLRKDTILVSVAGASGEFGTIQPIAQLAAMTHRVGALFHSDLAQVLGKMPLNIGQLGVDLATFSGHKIYGPQGVGALYLHNSKRLHLAPLFFGGAQERGVRPGSLAVPLIAGMGKACELLQREGKAEWERMRKLSWQFQQALAVSKKIQINGGGEKLPNLLNFTILGLDERGDICTSDTGSVSGIRHDKRRSEGLLAMLPQLAIAYSSACQWNCRNSEPPVSEVLSYLGVPDRLLRYSARVSWGRYTSEQELMLAARYILECCGE